MESLHDCSKLKPCKHCGREVRIREVRNNLFNGWISANTPSTYMIRCQCGIQTKEYKSKAGLIACWNREVKS